MPSETPHRLPRRLRGFVMYGRARMVCPATNSVHACTLPPAHPDDHRCDCGVENGPAAATPTAGYEPSGGDTMIRVSVTYGDLTVEADFESDAYSPDIVEDLTTRCCTAVLATLRHLWTHQEQ